MLQLFRRKKTQLRKRDKIADPLQDAQKQQPGSYVIRNAIDQWEPWAARYTTTAHFGRVEEIRYFNNCGPTALTNLLLMAGKRFGQLAGDAGLSITVWPGSESITFILSTPDCGLPTAPRICVRPPISAGCAGSCWAFGPGSGCTG